MKKADLIYSFKMLIMSCSNGQGDIGLEDMLSLLIIWAKVSRRIEEVIWFSHWERKPLNGFMKEMKLKLYIKTSE